MVNRKGLGVYIGVMAEIDPREGIVDRQLIGAIEAGGTKMVLATGYADGTIVERASISTEEPAKTVPAMVEWLSGKGIAALGIAAFGPTAVNPKSPDYGHILQTPKLAWRGYDFLGEMRRGLGVPCGYDTDVNGATAVNPKSPDYGHILQTPKLAWRGYDFLGEMRRGLGVPCGYDTDVNGACLGEVMYGAGKGLDNVIYITAGTGIGAGVYVDGHLLHGMLHPEAGHIVLARVPGDEGFACNCPSHDSCFEGLAAGPAVVARYGVERASDMADDEGFLELESAYIAQGIVTYIYTLSPQRIVLGGGVPDHAPKLMARVRAKVLEQINGYLATPELTDIDGYIVPPACGGDQGVLGAIALGVRALEG